MLSKSIKMFVFGLITLLVISGVFIWSGIFNISANDKHWTITTTLLEVIRDSSISKRSSSIQVPDLMDNKRVATAAPNYAAMCAQCHLSPGVEKTELYEGLYPQPPVFTKSEHTKRKPEEMFWIIKNGLKMTGMPAWGRYNSDEQIWDLVAFIPKLNEMSKERYQKLVDEGEHTHAKGGHDDMGSNDLKIVKPKKSHNDDGHKH